MLERAHRLVDVEWSITQVLTDSERGQLARRVAVELRAAKIEALEEVARAGCVHCTGMSTFAPEPIPYGKHGRWLHLKRGTKLRDDDTDDCQRPEVWDARAKLKEGR